MLDYFLPSFTHDLISLPFKDELVPAEYKTGHPQDGSDTDYHRAQLIAQALLVEQHFHRFVRKVKIVYEQLEAPILFEISGADKVRVLQMLEAIRNIITQELLPEPTPHEAKCKDCEFWRVCHLYNKFKRDLTLRCSKNLNFKY